MSRRAATAVAAGLAVAAGAAVAVPYAAHATSTFTLQRVAGSDRYQTADVIDQAAFPTGEPTVLLADAIPGHQSDALAASGVAGAYSIGLLLTDNTNSVPANTLTALKNNKVARIEVLGGTAAVSQAQVNQLKAANYIVQTPFQGADRYKTMQLVDNSMAGMVGTDASGSPTAILASGADNHLVDALSGGALAYAKHFPVILTNSTSSTLQPEASQVISQLGIKHLIVAGGTGSIPASQYSPAPTGVTKVDVEAGSDRSDTSRVLADYAINQGFLKSTNLDLARGDDGADALAGAPFGGLKGYPTVVTNSITDIGSAATFAGEHTSTLAGISYIFGGTAAVTDAQKNAVQSAGQGPAAPGAKAGTFGTAGASTPPVTSVSSTSFTENSLAYTYGSGDTYQLAQASSTPGGSATCAADSYADFQNRLSDGDSVSGNYQPGGTSTFCLDDIAPHPPTSVASAPNSSGGGVTVTWSAPSTAGADGVSGYSVYRAAATASSIPGGPPTCPAATTTAAGASPQNPPGSPYTAVVSNYSTTNSSGSYAYNDTTTTPSSAYCYAVSSQAPNAAGTGQTGTATAAGANQLSPSTPAPVTASVAPASTAPRSISTSATPSSTTSLLTGDKLSVTFDQPVAVASNYSVTLASPCPVTATASTTPDTCTDSQEQLNPADSSEALSNSNTTVTFTLTTPPVITKPSTPPGPIAPSQLEVLVQTGVTGTTTPAQPWNLPGSAVATGPLAPGTSGAPATLNRVFAGSNANLPAAPVVSAVASGTNTVSFTCQDKSSTELNIYNQNGVLLGNAPCGTIGTAQSGVSPVSASGQPSPFTFTSGSIYLFTESAGAAPGSSGQESQAASLAAS